MDSEQLLAFDRQHLWHPYSAIGDDEPVYHVVSADGVRLKLADGRQIIDGMASWWCAIHGYNHPHLQQALNAQARTMAHVMFGGLTHEPAVKLGQQLIEITPPSLQAIFYADSGSVSVEAALKMAVQYQQARQQKNRRRLLTVRGGYHGDTIGAMAVSDPQNSLHRLFNGLLPVHIHAPQPLCRFSDDWEQSACNAIEDLVERHQHEIAAIIVEPIAQGAGGMWFYHPEYLRQFRRICDEYELLLIFDEIATGFGRTGELFAMQHADVIPDVLCLGKALTGGMMTMAATMTSVEVAQTINQSDAGVFMHGPTFMGNPLACAIASASIELLIKNDWQTRVKRIETIMRQQLEAAREAPGVLDVRVLGAIGVIETVMPVDRARLCRFFVDSGVWIRPFNHFIYIMPPYVINEEDLLTLCRSMVEAVNGSYSTRS